MLLQMELEEKLLLVQNFVQSDLRQEKFQDFERLLLQKLLVQLR